MAEGLGDDALAASGGQVIVGKESKFRVFYRLVNTIYVLGIASVEQQGEEMHANAFQCAGIVNQAVTVLVAVCKGVDVTPDKLLRKYTEIYLALDMVLRGVGATRLASILASIQGEGVPHMVLSAIDVHVDRIVGMLSKDKLRSIWPTLMCSLWQLSSFLKRQSLQEMRLWLPSLPPHKHQGRAHKW